MSEFPFLLLPCSPSLLDLTHKEGVSHGRRDAIALPQRHFLGLQLQLPRVLLLPCLFQLVVVLATLLRAPAQAEEGVGGARGGEG